MQELAKQFINIMNKRTKIINCIVDNLSNVETVSANYGTKEELLSNVLDKVIQYMGEKDLSDNNLPSRFQIYSYVSIKLRPMFVVEKARVIKVHFTESKVLYDLEVECDYPTPPEDGEKCYTRIYNVDSAIVSEV